MKYSVFIINSDNLCDYYENAADGIKYNNLKKDEVDNLISLALRQGYTVVVQKYEEEE